jgi:hypothetical protein
MFTNCLYYVLKSSLFKGSDQVSCWWFKSFNTEDALYDYLLALKDYIYAYGIYLHKEGYTPEYFKNWKTVIPPKDLDVLYVENLDVQEFISDKQFDEEDLGFLFSGGDTLEY